MIDVRSAGSWAVRHGLIRGAMKVASRLGESHAQLSIRPEVREDPYPTYARARARGPFVQGALTSMATTHEMVSFITRDNRFQVGFDLPGVPALLRLALTRGPGRIVGPIDKPSLLAVNPPEHTRYRRQVAKVFTARAIGAMESEIHATAKELLDRLEGREEADLVADYAALLPVSVILHILGIPAGMRDDFLDWGNSAAMSLDIGLSWSQYQQCESGVAALNEWMYGHIDDLRRNPGDDLLSGLVHVQDEGRRMTDLEIMATVNLVLAAGFETTVNLISSGTRLLAAHPGQRRLLREDPSLWDNAVEETLRYEAPVQETLRCAVEEVELDGITIKRGEFIGVLIGAANRDPAVFADPDRFDITRPNARDHVSFSGGVHFCLGAALARMEGRIALQALFERFPDLAVYDSTWRGTRTLRGLESLHVRL